MTGFNPITRSDLNAETNCGTQLVLKVQADEEERIGCCKAGKTTIYQIIW